MTLHCNVSLLSFHYKTSCQYLHLDLIKKKSTVHCKDAIIIIIIISSSSSSSSVITLVVLFFDPNNFLTIEAAHRFGKGKIYNKNKI